MAVVGPGAAEVQATDVKPMLEGASEYEYITILNPLSDDFAVRVAQDVPVNMPVDIKSKTALVQSEGDVVRNYGLSLKNPDFVSRKHIYNDTIIPAGGTVNFKGNEAQVAIRQLVNEIIQREGKTKLMSDPVVRNEVEGRIIVRRGSIQDLMDNAMTTPRAQMDEAIKQSNEVSHEEPAFPGLSQAEVPNPAPGTGTNYTPKLDQDTPNGVERPKKADS